MTDFFPFGCKGKKEILKPGNVIFVKNIIEYRRDKSKVFYIDLLLWKI